MSNFLAYASVGALMFMSLLLIFIILLQRGRGGGLAGALGGAGGQSALGTKAGDIFTKVTIVIAAVWIGLACASIYAVRAAVHQQTDVLPEDVASENAGGADAAGGSDATGDAANGETPLTAPAGANGTDSEEAASSSAETPAADGSSSTPGDGGPAAPDDAGDGPALGLPEGASSGESGNGEAPSDGAAQQK